MKMTRTRLVMSAVTAVAFGAFVASPLVNAQTSALPNPGKGPSANGNSASETDPTRHDSMAAPMTADKDIIEVATGPGMTEVSTLVAAVKEAGLVDTLKGPGPFTVFAPTNAAFMKLGKDKCDMLMKPENKDKLKQILLYHVHAGDAIKAADVKTMSLSTAEGKPLMVKKTDDGVMINNAKVIKTDIVCKNGVIHWIDTVLMPDMPMGDDMKPAGGM